MLAIDDAQSLFATSAYVDPTYQPLESFSLTVPRLLLEFIAGTKSFVSIHSQRYQVQRKLTWLRGPESQTTGSILLAPSHLSPRQSPAMSRFLGASNGNVKLETTSPYVSVGSSFDIYSATLAGLSKFDLAPRLERKEAVGVVKMLQGYRGVREGESRDAECSAIQRIARGKHERQLMFSHRFSALPFDSSIHSHVGPTLFGKIRRDGWQSETFPARSRAIYGFVRCVLAPSQVVLCNLPSYTETRALAPVLEREKKRVFISTSFDVFDSAAEQVGRA